MTIQEIIQKYGVEQLGRFYSKYRAVVVDNLDTELNKGRIKVFIPTIHGGLTVWANPGSFQGGPGFGVKTLTPKANSIVWVEFEGGDPLRPIWYNHGWGTFEKPEEFDEDTMGVITPNGNKILLREKEGQLFIETKGDIDIKTDGIIKSESKEVHIQEGKVGIPQTTDIVARLNAIEEKLNSYITAMKTSPPITPSDSGAAFKAWMVNQVGAIIPKTVEKDIASETIKQPR